MKRASFAILGALVVLVAYACGGGAPASQVPGGPGATTAPGGAQTTAPNVPVSEICQGMPTFSLQTPSPSFAQDAELVARFPSQIEGQPVEDVNTGFFIQLLCYLGDQEAISRFAAAAPGTALGSISLGSGRVTLDEEPIVIQAIRIPGGDASQMVQNLPAFAIALGGDPEEVEGMTTEQISLGGKNAYKVTNNDGDVSYFYATGDTAYTISSGVDEALAGRVFAGLP